MSDQYERFCELRRETDERSAFERAFFESISMPIDEQIALAIKAGPGSLPYRLWQHVIEDPEGAIKSAQGLLSAVDTGVTK